MIALFLIATFLLGVYSYSQIDLNLTLFSAPLFLNFQKVMIGIGYFNRPLSTFFFIFLISSIFILYLFLLKSASRLSVKTIALGVVGVVAISLLAYPAFSYDIFNYMFDARIVTKYGSNPYFFKGLDFPSDDWIRFMRWTHRTYPYGPFWLILTVPISFLGLGKFVPTLLLFKLFFVGTYVCSILLIKKISQIVFPKSWKSNVIFFAFNPLVVVEFLISPHIDAAMTLFLLIAVWLLVKKQRSRYVIFLVLSAAVKFVTISMAPLFFLKNLQFHKFINFSIISMLIILVPVVVLREFYPWYFLPPLALVSLSNNKKIKTSAVIFAFGALFQYVPFIFVGSYPPEVFFVKNIATGLTILISIAAFLIPSDSLNSSDSKVS